MYNWVGGLNNPRLCCYCGQKVAEGIRNWRWASPPKNHVLRCRVKPKDDELKISRNEMMNIVDLLKLINPFL